MKKLCFSICAMLLTLMVTAQESTQWYRYSAISPDGQTIAFTYKGDIYTVPVNGGQATPLTYHKAYDFMPVWSNDGKTISFASDRHGNFDVFVVDVKGGEPTRLTYHSASEYPYTFSSDDKKVIFGGQRMDIANHRQYPTGSQPELYEVAVAGSRVDQVWTIPAEDVQMNKAGDVMVYHDKKGGEDTFRKHHKSAITRDLWIFDTKTGEHKMITDFYGEDRTPVFSPDEKSLYYLSEQSGTFNVHKLDLSNPKSTVQVSDFKKHPVRFLTASDNGTLCYSYDGELYTQKEGQKPAKVNITINTARKANDKLIMSLSGRISEMDISPDGKEVVYVVRGEVFVSSVEGKFTKRITNTAAQEKFVSFTKDGKGIIYASERNAKWSIFKTTKVRKEEPYFYASTLLKEEPVIDNENDNYEPKYSPDGKELAFIENRTTLKVLNLKTKKTRTLLTPRELYYMRDGDQYFSWSPDSKWILAEHSPVMANTEVVLLAADGSKKMINLTESGYGDYSPVWANGGKQIMWFSDRDGMRSYANSGSRQMDVYTMFMTQDSWDKYNMSKDDYALWKDIQKKQKEAKKKADAKDKKKKKKKDNKKKDVKKKSLEFDWDGMRDRKARLTIHSSKLGDALLSKDGETLFYLARFEGGYNIWKTNLRTKETKMFVKLGTRSGGMMWDKKKENIFILSNGSISKINSKSKKRSSISTRGELTIDLTAERKHMFDHVWKRNKEMFYISDYHGADWNALRATYEAKLPSVGNDFEFAELLSEMLGELNVSHSGARYRGYDPSGDRTASLGIFFDYDYKGDGIKITEIIKGGPLDKKSIKVKPGMIIKEIDGVLISANADYAKYLNRKSEKFTSLKIYDPSTKKEEYLTIKPISLGRERGLLYRRWVKKNEEEVERLSNGKIGYIHLPGMNDGRYRNAYENAMGKYHDKEGLIVDTRFNGGGDLVADLAMFLTGEKFIDYAIESRSIGYEPGYRWTKPTVAMANEANYSDGHCFACAYKDLGIGKLVGMPVPGTCSFAGWEMLQNGKVLWGSIPVSAKNKAGEWLENNETVPDVQVKNMPETIVNGTDEQLEKAIAEILKMTK